MDNRPPPRGNQGQHNRNQNFRRPLPPPINQRITEDQQIRPPFLDNCVDEEGGNDPMEIQNHHFDYIYFRIYVAEEEHNLFAQEEQPESALHSSPSFYEEYNKQRESSCFPLCFSSFDFLKQILRVSNKTHKIEGVNNVMAF